MWLEVVLTCEACQGTTTVSVCEADWLRYHNNEGKVQACFPYLDDNARELIISNTCGSCFNRMFGDD